MTDDFGHWLERLPTFESQMCGASIRPDLSEASAHGTTMRQLAARLIDAEIMDNRSIETPGAAIVLPWGGELVRRLRDHVDSSYQARGFESYEFPEIAPSAVYAPAVAAFPQVQDFLYVADKRGLDRGVARGVLPPSGESVVYHYWSKQLRSSRDLPQRLARNARYFRPVPSGGRRAGRGVFRALEAPDVHEFHAAVGDEAAAQEELARCIGMVDEVIRSWHVPVVWSMRPPWTNHGVLYRAAYGADAVLPNGHSVQVGVVYDQGTIFSREFDIRLRDCRPHRHPIHITGCVTRRLLLANLFQSHASTSFSIHPDIAPVQVVLRGDAAAMRPITEFLGAHGLRCRAFPALGRELLAVERRWIKRGAPLQLLVQGRRFREDIVRVVLRQSDGDEVELSDPWEHDPPAFRTAIASSLRSTASGLDRSSSRYRPTRCASALDASLVVAGGGVAAVGLDVTQTAVESLESRVAGEVLGFVPTADELACVESGARVRSLAVVGRRA